jgi:hypothetical protein
VRVVPALRRQGPWAAAKFAHCICGPADAKDARICSADENLNLLFKYVRAAYHCFCTVSVFLLSLYEAILFGIFCHIILLFISGVLISP